jgi:uncharacterized protein
VTAAAGAARAANRAFSRAAADGCHRYGRVRPGQNLTQLSQVDVAPAGRVSIGAVLTFDIQVVPRASRGAVGGAVGDRLRVAVTAPPVDGAANAAVIDALAAAFGVRRAAVEIVRGETGRRKTVRIEGGSAATLEALRRG